MIRTSVEGARGCGYRKPGGLYLVGDELTESCPLLPWALEVCPTCGQGIKPARGWTWVEPPKLFPASLHGSDVHNAVCPLGFSLKRPEYHRMGERAGLIWIGEKFYSTPHDFLSEAAQMGVSRRIKAVPRGFELGMWVYLGHRKAVPNVKLMGLDRLTGQRVFLSDEATTEEDREARYSPGVIALFRPYAIEYIVKGDETDEEIEALEERGIECVKVVQATEQMEVFP